MPTDDPRAKVASVRAAIATRLQTVPGLTVLDWPATAAHLIPPAITIGHPSHQLLDDPLDADVKVGSWGWRMLWPLTLYVPEQNDSAGAAVLDNLVGEVIAAVRSGLTLDGDAVAALIVDGDQADLNDPDDPVRMLVQRLTLLSHSELPA